MEQFRLREQPVRVYFLTYGKKQTFISPNPIL